MPYLDVWVVAAAIMLKSNSPRHYKSITVDIIATELTTLGMKGKSPEQTVGALLRKHSSFFARLGGGEYDLIDRERIATHPEVKKVLGIIRE